MADIVQLKENGISKYLKTHVNAVDGLDTKLDGLNTKIDAKQDDLIKHAVTIFTGAMYLTNTQVVKYNPDDLKIGIWFDFTRYDPPNRRPLDFGNYFSMIPKTMINYGVEFRVPTTNSYKGIIINKDTITGVKENEDGAAKRDFVLRRVLIF
ncbi:hypothetical protein LDK57_09310 [Melissococcus plutonius]|uniref:hypothetical protein n=1 Tax=Melissococcus plutonius TaxID=33970 RepID=UPI0021E5CC86|nr:hypothetical protein [Melissococcus plutonius]MCV2499673.1 hypothetical protein [Melissococcus plutonius]MCV2508283.1 hypothetical protein [Melissococcus plutonius]MCV2528146.1 hypothetical protein [Melissococcus plutonius]